MSDINNLQDKLLDVINKLEAAGDKIAPQILDSAIFGTRLEAGIDLTTGVVCAALSFVMFKGFRRFMTVADAKDYSEERTFITSLLIVVIGSFSGIWAAAQLLSSSNWIALFSPETYLIMHFLKL